MNVCRLISSVIFIMIIDLTTSTEVISQIRELTLDKCIVTAKGIDLQYNDHGVMVDRVTDHNDQIQLITDQLKEIFKEEPKVEIIQLDNAQLVSDQLLTSSADFTIYPKLYKDRTCLIPPPSEDASSSMSSKPYTGPLTLNALLQFVNQNCFTFRTISGGMTAAGILEHSIMNNLFRLQESSSKCTRVSSSISKEEFFWEYLSRSRPVIIEGGASNWTALSKWRSDYLRQQYQYRQVHIKLTERGEFEGVESAQLWPGYSADRIPIEVREQLPFPDLVVVRPATADMTFAEFIDLISIGMNKSGISAYLEYSSIPSYMPELEEDIIEPFSGNGEKLLERRHLNMWLSDGNTLGKLHFDPYDNFLCQLSGEKELILFEPYENENLYEAHIPEALLGYNKKQGKIYRHSLLESTSMVMSPVDILKPNLKNFPNFSKAKRLECTIRPGDVLFMPAFWWHEVQSHPDSKQHRNLAVNYWYEPLLTKEFPCAECRLYFNQFYQNLLHNPPPSSV